MGGVGLAGAATIHPQGGANQLPANLPVLTIGLRDKVTVAKRDKVTVESVTK